MVDPNCIATRGHYKQRQCPQGRAETFGGAGALKYKRGTWNTAFIRAVLLADMCIEMDVSVLIQQQIAWHRFEKETQNRKDNFKLKC